MIGVMDSGVGGVSVLRRLRALMPGESFLYLGDSAHAPYGNKTPEQIRVCVMESAARLCSFGCKALVVACNTATAVAIDELRKRYTDIPVIGIEPAVKPALESICARLERERGRQGNIMVLATQVTLGQRRFRANCRRLCACCDAELVDGASASSEIAVRSLDAADPRETAHFGGRIRIFPIAAQRIVELVERGMAHAPEAVDYLSGLLAPYRDVRFDAVVLGCTHFPFASDAIISALGYPVELFDGGDGVARQLRHRLEVKGILRDGDGGYCGSVVWCGEDAERARQLRTLMRT